MILGYLREAFFYGIAFAFIYIIVRGGSISEWQTVSELNLLANIGLFVPIGLLLPFVYRVNGRSVDIDDVILNVLGTVIGYCLYYFINKQVLLKLKQ